MDVSSSVFQIQDNCEFQFGCENLLEQSFSATDAGYFSACSSLSPASSTDSSCFSPPTFHHGQLQENFSKIFSESFCLKNNISQENETKNKAPKRTGRPRSKFPGVKRQNASEREKLRMRDLTKALQHLRTYLPPSVAPVGQTLTKIETLRLTIRYISHLSDQLELGQENVTQGNVLPARPASDLPVCQVNQEVPQMSSFSTQEFFSMPNMPYYQSSDDSASCQFQCHPHQLRITGSPSSSTAITDNANKYGQYSC